MIKKREVTERTETTLFWSEELGRSARAAEAEIQAIEAQRRLQETAAETRKRREVYQFD